MKKTVNRLLNPFWAGLLLAIAGIILVALTGGCATKPDDGGVVTDERCAQARQVLNAYEASLAFREPSEDEVVAAKAAKAVLIMFCGEPGALIPVEAAKGDFATLPIPRQPQRIKTVDPSGVVTRYYLEVPFSIIQDPTGLFRPKDASLATITTGPFWRKSRTKELYMPDQAWLQGVKIGEPTMLPIR